LFGGGPGGGQRESFWLSADYVHGWLRQPTAAVPLFTTGPTGGAALGVLGQSGTNVLFGTDDIRYNNLNGIRGALGFWLDDAQHLSLSVGTIYLLQPTHTAFSTASDANGNPVLARPILNGVTGLEQSYLVAAPGLIMGSATVLSRSEFFGAEINGGYSQALSSNLKGTALIGYRGLRFAEGLTVQDQFQPLANGVVTFEGSGVGAGTMLSEQARFQTTNAFNGLQFGGQLRWQQDWLFVDAYGKLALGITDEHVTINGATALGGQVAPGEVLTALTNIGQERRQVFGAVPEIGVNVGVDVWQCLRLKVGYSFLAWSAVARATDQIDRVINPGRVPTDPNFGAVAGPARPALSLTDHVLWLQTVNVGVELHY
jgi:hypothetical protein